ncbi:hypothetical protein Dd1591_4261 [Dickeya chrysanthemi Ech1591]|uniref:Uncharacterized protein n=1 Tax=Dickeya chrysanthemi (strain Ech1591) TaxID=561229 RepID=C6CR34_DICC1|nr:hypothetical protein Dd1591_4261 [Dickeya chrysanthemi Ech1591]
MAALAYLLALPGHDLVEGASHLLSPQDIGEIEHGISAP